MDRNDWQRLLTEQEQPRGYQDGFKLLFCPWRVINTARSLFLSLNPGHDPSGELMRVASDERGNSYLIKRKTRHSPMAAQYRMLCDLMGEHPEEVLAGALMPYRTPRWEKRRDQPNVEIASGFWQSIISRSQINRVICMGRDVEDQVIAMTGADLEAEIPAGWGQLTVRRHVMSDGTRIYGLLHLSTFKMLSRPACVERLRELFEPDSTDYHAYSKSLRAQS